MVSEHAYEALMQFLYQAPIGLVQTTLCGDIEMINPMSANLLMPLSSDGGLDNLFALLEGVAPQLRGMAAAAALPSGEICQSIRVTLPAACGALPGTAPQVLSIGLLKLDAERLMAVLTDVTREVHREQEGLQRKLNDAALIDTLTQLPNRAAMRECIQKLLARKPSSAARGFAVLLLNGDRFKRLNDTLGPAVGDALIGMMADRLRTALRQRDRLHARPRDPRYEPSSDAVDGIDAAGRGSASAQAPEAPPDLSMLASVGGDEFVVVLDHLRHPDRALVVAQRLQAVLTQPFLVAQQQVHCSVSIGVVLQAHATGGADTLLQDAGIAVAEAKLHGGGRCVVFEPEMQQRAERRAGIEAELRVALQSGQLFVVYQPVVGLMPGGLLDCSASVEALVRWRHPVRGEVPPVEFIGIAEDCGLIGALGDFVLDTACRQFVKWQLTLGDAAPRLLAVNVSRAQLAQPGWVDAVLHIVTAVGIAPEQLQLEVTESLAGQDELVQARLTELKALGIKIALDDFGTGYSSLASLHLLPVDTVKIDRSFVSRSAISHHHRVLIDATVRVAHSLGMNTVAEGIETVAQAAVVRELGCDKAQGYLYSRPMEASALATWLNATSAVRAPHEKVQPQSH